MIECGNCDVCGTRTEVAHIMMQGEVIDICKECWIRLKEREGD